MPATVGYRNTTTPVEGNDVTTAEPTGHEPTIAERVDYTRTHLPADQRDAYEAALRDAGRQVAEDGDVTALSEVVEQWWVAARLEHHGGEGWQRQKRLLVEGRWDELFPGPPVDVDVMLRESRP
jgi:Family of unknown function (DUF6247)